MGEKIGRSVPDAWISDEDLYRLVVREVRPQIRLRRLRAEERSEAATRTAVAFTVLVVIVGVGGAIFLRAPRLAGPAFAGVLRSVPGGAVVVAYLIAVLLCVLFIVLAVRASRKAKRAHAAGVRVLLDAAYQGAETTVGRRRQRDGRPLPAATTGSFASARPQPIMGTITPRQAEELAAQWMRYLGAPEAQVTRYQGDGGIDVVADRAIAQVKHYSSANVGVTEIRELAGVAAVDRQRRSVLFFASSGYAPGAVEFANDAGVALFIYDWTLAELKAVNSLAAAITNLGLARA